MNDGNGELSICAIMVSGIKWGVFQQNPLFLDILSEITPHFIRMVYTDSERRMYRP